MKGRNNSFIWIMVSLLWLVTACDDAGISETKPQITPSPSQTAKVISTTAVIDPERAKTVIFEMVDGTVREPENWNPLAPERRMDNGFHQAVIEPLFILNYETGKIEPWLGESMTANETLDVWTLKLRSGIKWSDGELFSAEDVIFTVNLLLSHVPELNGSADMQTWVKQVAKVDDLTVQFTLHKANPRFQLDLWSVKVWGGPTIVPQHIWQGQNPLTFKNYDPSKGWPIFTGAYKLSQVSPDRMEYVRNDNWWGAQSGWKELPKPEKLAWIASGEEEIRVARMITSEVDALGGISLDSLLQIKKQNSQIITYFDDLPYAWIPDPCSRSFDFNLTVPPWNDPEMRWAVNYAIDRNEIVSFAFNDTTIPARHFFPSYPALNRYVDLLEQEGLYEKYPLLEHNLEKTRTIIESKGYQLNAEGIYEKAGQELALNFSVANDIAFRNMGEILQQQFQRVGIKSVMDAQDYGGWYDTLLVGHFTGMVGWWSCGSVNEPWASMDTFNPRWLKPIDQRTSEGQNVWRWSGAGAEKYGRLVDEIGSLPLGDPKIEGLFVEAMDIWLQELPIIPLVQAGVLIPFNTTYWTGWPTAKNNYIHPPTWWQSTHDIIHNLQPTQP